MTQANEESPLERMQRFEDEHRHLYPQHPVVEAESAVTFDSDLIPDLEYDGTSDEHRQLDEFFKRIQILDAYKALSEKATDLRVRGTSKQIQIRCPRPSHKDAKPSASMNIATNEWKCHVCDSGGGVLQMAMARDELPTSGMRGKEFVDFRRRIAVELGYKTTDKKGITPIVSTPSTPSSAATSPFGMFASSRLDDAAYHGVAGEVVRTLEPLTEADPIAILVQLLTAFGNIVGREVHYFVGEQRHFTNLFVVLVGATAKARKGTSWSMIARLLEQVDPEWMRNCLTEGIVSGEGLLHRVRDRRYEIVVGKKQDDGTTPEEEVVADAGISDKRLLCKEEEFAGVLKVARREGNTVSVRVRHLWDTGDLNSLAKQNPDSASGAHVSIVGHVTAHELTDTLTKSDEVNGFANRFLWFSVKRSKLLAIPPRIPDAEVDRLSQLIRTAVDFARASSDISLEPSAEVRWKEVYAELSRDEPGRVGSIIARAEPQVLRVALLYALLDCADGVRVEHIEAARALVLYSLESSRRIFDKPSKTDDYPDRILHTLKLAGAEGLTRTEIQTLVFKNKGRSDDIDSAIAALESRSLVETEITLTGGRSSMRVRLTGV